MNQYPGLSGMPAGRPDVIDQQVLPSVEHSSVVSTQARACARGSEL